MTRKKSNVKALALAVTCAILAGGYSGLNPVYAAADKLYKDATGSNVTTIVTANEITELNVGGAIIGATGTAGGTSVSSVTAHLGGFNNVLVNDGLIVGAVGGTVSTNNVAIGGGGIIATNGTDKVTVGNGAIIATGNIEGNGITAKGNLSVTGTSTFTGETTFANGISAAGDKFKVDGATGDISTNGSVTAKGGLNAANGNFTVNGTTGDTTVKGKLDVTGDITGQNITAKGALKGQTLGIGTNGTEFTVDKDGAVKAAGGKVEIDKTGKAIFGNIAGNITTIEGKQINTGSIVATDTTAESTISGVKMLNGKITASSMEINGPIDLDNLTVNNQLTVGTFSVDKTGVVKNLTSINDVAVAKNGTGLKIGSATVGDTNPFSSTGFTVDATGNVKATQVTADTITDGQGFKANGGNVTANTITANTSATLAGVTFDASGVNFNGKDIKNVANVTATTVTATTADLGKLHIEGAKITNVIDPGGGIGLGMNVTVNDAGGLGGITQIDGVAVGVATGNGLEFGGNAIIGATGKPFSSNGFEVDGAGNVTGNSFKVDADNYFNSNGLTTEKAVIGANTLNGTGISTTGTLDVDGVAKFGKNDADQTKITQGEAKFTQSGKTTTITGGKITTDTLTVNDIVLKNSMKDNAGNTITIKGSDGSMSVAGGKFAVDDKGQVTNHITAGGAGAADTIFATSETGIDATFKMTGETASSGLKIEHNHAALNASGGAALDLKDKIATLGIGSDSLTTYTNNAIESKVGADASRTLKADEIVDAVGSTTVTTKSGGTTFGDGTANNTLINGSIITSTNGGTTGVLNGSNLTLTDATGAVTRSTKLTAGGVTFTGADGRSDATGVKNQTTIDGGIITTDTLNVQRIELGDKLVDSNGASHGGNLSMDEYGNIKAAGGKFTVAGTNQTNPGALHNEVGGKTFLDTTETGASMKFDTTTPTGGIKSEVSVADGKAEMAVGANAAVTATDGKVEIKGGTQTVTTTNDGTVFENSAHNTPFGGGSETKTTIYGNEITTGKITTDQLVIKGNGQGEAAGAGTGSIALGGNGSIKSNIQDASGTKEATFETEFDHIKSEVTDGTTTTKNEVKASGNTNTVTEIATSNNTESYQTATSIGGVVTNGTVKMKQELTAEGVKVTDELGDPANYTQITNKDVSITDPKNAGKRINLSDLGQLNDLDGELTARPEYTSNPTAVGGINAEAAIRREEVARLDNRIDDVNNRVDKVGAMAAAIASLKSIGYDPQAPSEFSIGLGQYKGETGVAMGFFHYPNKNFMINVSLSTAGGETMGGIGATWRFGHKSPQKLLEEQREAQAKKELAAAEKYQAAAKLAKEAQERAEYAAKLARQAQVSADNAKAAADATQAKHFQ